MKGKQHPREKNQTEHTGKQVIIGTPQGLISEVTNVQNLNLKVNIETKALERSTEMQVVAANIPTKISYNRHDTKHLKPIEIAKEIGMR